jgi:hypothetical protein
MGRSLSSGNTFEIAIAPAIYIVKSQGNLLCFLMGSSQVTPSKTNSRQCDVGNDGVLTSWNDTM